MNGLIKAADWEAVRGDCMLMLQKFVLFPVLELCGTVINLGFDLSPLRETDSARDHTSVSCVPCAGWKLLCVPSAHLLLMDSWLSSQDLLCQCNTTVGSPHSNKVTRTVSVRL